MRFSLFAIFSCGIAVFLGVDSKTTVNIFQVSNFPAIFLELRGCLHEKTRTGTTFIPT